MSLIAKQLADSIALLSHEKQVEADIAAAEEIAKATLADNVARLPEFYVHRNHYATLSGALISICARLARELDAKDREIEELKRRLG